MNEIEKLYKNAGLSNMWVEKYDDKQIFYSSYNDMIATMMKINDWSRKVAVEVAKKECRKALPPFTTEKQLELIKIFAKRELTIDNTDYGFSFSISDGDEFAYTYITKKDFSPFENALANLINNLWQDLTEEEKEQIRGILNG